MQRMTDHYTISNARTAKVTIHTGVHIDHIHTGTRGGSVSDQVRARSKSITTSSGPSN